MLMIVTDGAMLWTRWALRRLGHLLAGYPTLLIKEVNGFTSRDQLHRHFDAVVLPDQPPEIQQAIGVAFGQQAAGGFGLAVEVGIDPALADDSTRYPIHYRLGVGEGMLLTRHGQIGLLDFFVSRFLGILSPIPPALLVPWLNEMAEKVAQATWIGRWRFTTVDPKATLSALESAVSGLGRRCSNRCCNSWLRLLPRSPNETTTVLELRCDMVPSHRGTRWSRVIKTPGAAFERMALKQSRTVIGSRSVSAAAANQL